MADSSEETSHFEQVLGRLDALLKRNQTIEPLPAPSAATAERDSSSIPVLTEIYQAEPGRVVTTQSAGNSVPLLTEIASLPAFTPEHNSTPAWAPHVNVHVSNALLSRQATTAFNHDELVEKTLAPLLPLLQNRISQIFREEAEQALAHIQTGLEERLRGEISKALEDELGALLKHSQPEEHDQTEM